MGLNWQCPFSPFICPITYRVGFWYFRKFYIRDFVSNKTCQNFCDKSLIIPGRKYPILQRSQPISYKAKLFSQRDNVYLVDFKYNITYQNIWEGGGGGGGTGNKGQTYFYTIMPKMAKKSYLTTYMDELSTKSQSLF